MSVETLFKEVKALPLEQQIELVQRVRDLIDERREPDLTLEETRELDRRLEKYEQNPNDGAPWDEVKARLQKQRERRP